MTLARLRYWHHRAYLFTERRQQAEEREREITTTLETMKRQRLLTP